MALKISRTAGCKIILTSSSDEKLKEVKHMRGIAPILTINYLKVPDWEIEAIRLNNGAGVDIVLENGGTSSLLKSIDATAKGGIISQVGYLGSQDAKNLDGLISKLIDKTIALRGINVGSRLELEKLNRLVTANEMRFQEVIDLITQFEDAPHAFAHLWSG